MAMDNLQVLQILPEQIGGPINQIEQSEHEGKENARYNVDSLGPGWEFGQPSFAPIPLWQRYMNLACT